MIKKIDFSNKETRAPFLALFFGRFKFIRKFTGGLWVKVILPEISFNEWVWIDADICSYYDSDGLKGLEYEDYRTRGIK